MKERELNAVQLGSIILVVIYLLLLGFLLGYISKNPIVKNSTVEPAYVVERYQLVGTYWNFNILLSNGCILRDNDLELNTIVMVDRITCELKDLSVIPRAETNNFKVEK